MGKKFDLSVAMTVAFNRNFAKNHVRGFQAQEAFYIRELFQISILSQFFFLMTLP